MSGLGELRVAVLKQAVKDWRSMCNKIKKCDSLEEAIYKTQTHFDELNQFFNSEWCELLCGRTDPYLLKVRLTKMYLNAIKKFKEEKDERLERLQGRD